MTINYYAVNVMKNITVFDYSVPDVKKITGAKYKWLEENKNILNTIQCECYFIYPDIITETENLKIITKEQYDDFCKVILTSDKSKINSNEYSIVTAQFSEGGGIVEFKITKPNKESSIVSVIIDKDGIAKTPQEIIQSNEKGLITILLTSQKWHSVYGLGVIHVESI